MQKYIILLFYFISSFIFFSNSLIKNEDILFEYDYDYKFYEYLAKNENRNILVMDDFTFYIFLDKYSSIFPYNGEKIIITKSGELFYFFSKNKNNQTPFLTKETNISSYKTEIWDKEELFSKIFSDFGIDLNKDINHNEIKYINFKLNNNILKEVEKEIKLIEKEIEKEINKKIIEPVYENITMKINLGYITIINVSDKKYLYFNSEKNNLEDSNFYKKINKMNNMLKKQIIDNKGYRS